MPYNPYANAPPSPKAQMEEKRKYDVYPGQSAGESSGQSPLEDFSEAWMGTNTRGVPHPYIGTEKADIDLGLSGEARGGQLEYANFLRAAMMGKGPSVAEQQLQRGREEAIRGAMSTAASGRGATAAAAGQQATTQAATIGQQSARDAAMIRAQEQQAYANQFGNLWQSMRMQDLQSRGLSIDEAKAQLEADTAYMNAQATIGEGEAGRRQKGTGGITAIVGGMFGGSDPNLKQNIQPVGTPAPGAAMGAQVGGQIGYNPAELGWGMRSYNQPSPMSQPGGDMFEQQQQARRMQDQMRQLQAAQQPQGAAPAGGGGGGGLEGLGAGLMGAGSILSGFDAKQGIYPMMTPSGVEMKQGIYPMQPYGPSSDPRNKMAVERFPNLATVSPVVQEAAQVGNYGYEYKPDAAALYGEQVGKQYFGPMANRTPDSLENNDLYNTAVKQGPDGNAVVDGGRAAITNIGVTSEIAREQLRQADELENMKAAIVSQLQGGDNRVAGMADRKFMKSRSGKMAPQRVRPGQQDYDPFKSGPQYSPPSKGKPIPGNREQRLKDKKRSTDGAQYANLKGALGDSPKGRTAERHFLKSPSRSEKLLMQYGDLDTTMADLSAQRDAILNRLDQPNAAPMTQLEKDTLFRATGRTEIEKIPRARASQRGVQDSQSERTRTPDEMIELEGAPGSEADVDLMTMDERARHIGTIVGKLPVGDAERARGIQEYANELNRNFSGYPPANLVYSRLKGKMPGVTAAEIKAALRDETDL